ncbi:MAG: nucleotide exchange factor GrpE [Ruminococcus sp.]|nr:nucleotide exchange factor GrpE [Ruminococcus sp.]
MIFLNENKIEVFNSTEFGTVRTLTTEDGKVLFCGADVAKALGYSNARDALARHCKEKGVVKHDTLTKGGIQELTYIDEGNVYRLITHSKLPNAERFEVWVFDDVLPEIRHTGSYGNISIESIYKRLEVLENKIDSLDKETKKLNRKFKKFIKSSDKKNEKIIVKSVSETAKSLVPYFDTLMKVIQNLLKSH